MRKAIIFDVDGTLWDAVDEIAEAWNLTVSRELGIDAGITGESMKPYMGRPMSEFAGLFPPLPEDKMKALLEKCCVEEVEYLETHPGKLYPMLREVLKELSDKYDLFIVSNCQEGYIEALLSSCDLGKYFVDFENYGRTKKEKAENIRILIERCDIDKAIYIGDTITDYESAAKNDIPFIFAEYGMGQVENARFKVKQPSEIPAVIDSMKYFSL